MKNLIKVLFFKYNSISPKLLMLKTVIMYLLLVIIFYSCENPVDALEEKIQLLWTKDLENISSSGITIGTSDIYFVSTGAGGRFYKVSKTGNNINSKDIYAGTTIGFPLLVNEYVYTNSGSKAVFAYKTSNLSILWQNFDFNWNPMLSSDYNNLYITDFNKITAMNRFTGEKYWENIIEGKNMGRPIIDNNRLYFATGGIFQGDGILYCINKNNGEIIYKTTIPYIEENDQFGGAESGVTLWNDYVFVASVNRYLYCINKNSGDIIWKFLADAPIQTTPVVSDNKVFFGSLFMSCYALYIPDGTLVWQTKGKASIQHKPQLYSSYILFPTIGTLLILDKNTGKEIIDLRYGNTGYDFFNAAWDSDGKIYATGHKDNQPILISYQFK